MTATAARPATNPVVLAMVSAGDIRSPAEWSGSTSHLAAALEDLGVSLIGICVQPPRVLRLVAAIPTLLRSRPISLGPSLRQRFWIAESGIMPTRLRSVVARQRLPTGRVQGVLQIGSEFLVPSTVPVATYADRTIVQAISDGEKGWLKVPTADRAWRIAQQRRMYRQARVCCAMSNWAARSFRDDYGIEVSKIRVVGVGANLTPLPAARDWHRPSFLFVGRDWKRKNGNLVVEAFCKLREELPQARLDIVGNHPPLDVAGVTGHGLLDMGDARDRHHLQYLYSKATCFVMPSSHEPSAVVYVQAGCAGIPSIGTTRGGSAELIGDGGRIVDPDRPEELLNAMHDLCDPVTAAALGRKASAHSRLYTWRNVALRILRALDIELPQTSLTASFLNEVDLGGSQR